MAVVLSLAAIVLASPPLSRADPKAGAGVEEGYAVGADGVRLFYRNLGQGKPVVVFVHGGPGLHMGDGGYEMEPLAGARTLVLYDQRGGGRSELVTDPKRLSAREHVRDLEALREHLGIERMALAGLSWGAGLASLYAAEHPERVERLLLVSPMPPARTPFFQDRLRAIETATGEAFAARLKTIRESLPRASDTKAVALCREWFDISSRPYLVDPTAFRGERSVRLCDAPPAALRNRFVVVSAVLESLGDWDFRPFLRNLGMPALVVEGEKTNVPLEATREWALAMPDARLLLVPGAGHLHFLERPDLFFPAAERFLEGQDPEGSEMVRRPS